MARIEQNTYSGATSVKATFGKPREVIDSKVINPIDLEESRAIGITLPFGNKTTNDSGYSKDNTSSTGIQSGTKPGTAGSTLFSLSYLTKDQVISNVRNLILTTRGERIMNPDFGTNIRDFLFEQNTPDIERGIRESIEDAFARYMPLCKIEDMIVTQKEQRIHIMLGFSVEEYNINEVLEITTGVA
jgi:phage baseplate assembly protein W